MSALRDQVVVRGQTLYAPLIACRPLDPADWPAPRQKAWRQIVADVGVEPDIYPGSIYVPCGDCGITVSVGPRQQEAREVAHGVGLAAYVLCFWCAAERQHGRRDATAMHLGNPFKRRR